MVFFNVKSQSDFVRILCFLCLMFASCKLLATEYKVEPQQYFFEVEQDGSPLDIDLFLYRDGKKIQWSGKKSSDISRRIIFTDALKKQGLGSFDKNKTIQFFYLGMVESSRGLRFKMIVNKSYVGGEVIKVNISSSSNDFDSFFIEVLLPEFFKNHSDSEIKNEISTITSQLSEIKASFTNTSFIIWTVLSPILVSFISIIIGWKLSKKSLDEVFSSAAKKIKKDHKETNKVFLEKTEKIDHNQNIILSDSSEIKKAISHIFSSSSETEKRLEEMYHYLGQELEGESLVYINEIFSELETNRKENLQYIQYLNQKNEGMIEHIKILTEDLLKIQYQTRYLSELSGAKNQDLFISISEELGNIFLEINSLNEGIVNIENTLKSRHILSA